MVNATMIYLELAIFLGAILLGSKMGGVAVGFASFFGVLLLAAIGVKPGDIPGQVVGVVLAIISAAATMETAGGTTYLSQLAKRLLRKNPKHITLVAALVGYFSTLFVGVNFIALSFLPAIVQVAKAYKIRPSRPLSAVVVASHMAAVAAPLAPSVMVVTEELEQTGTSYLQILAVMFPATLLATLIATIFCHFCGCELEDDPLYRERLAKNLVNITDKEAEGVTPPYAKRAVWILLLGVIATVGYAVAASESVALIQPKIMSNARATIICMFSSACLITWFCRLRPAAILTSQNFKTGTSSCICILGVALLGNTFLSAHLSEFKLLAEAWLQTHPWILVIIMSVASTLLYSQAATVKVMVPIALFMGLAPTAILSAFAGASALFIFPNYPVLLAAIGADDTGSTRVGKFMFNHPFLIPGIVAIALTAIFASLMCRIVI